MKKYVFLFFLLIGFLQNIATAQAVKLHGKLHVTGTQLLDEHNQPVVLRGMSYGWHNLWPRFYNAAPLTGCIKTGAAPYCAPQWVLNLMMRDI